MRELATKNIEDSRDKMNNEHKPRMGFKEYRDLIVHSGLQLIPSIGPAIASAYYGHKTEIRFKRIEEFYRDLATHIDNLENPIELAIIDGGNKNNIISMIEQLNDEIEKQSQQDKKQFFINFFINFMNVQDDTNNSKKSLYFEMLKELNISELTTLIDFCQSGSRSGVFLNNDEFRARIYKLKNYALLNETESRSIPGRGFQIRHERLVYKASRLGHDFYSFCLHPI